MSEPTQKFVTPGPELQVQLDALRAAWGEGRGNRDIFAYLKMTYTEFNMYQQFGVVPEGYVPPPLPEEA